MARTALQRECASSRIGFSALFILAPPLDIFRFDLSQGHAIPFAPDWSTASPTQRTPLTADSK
ncbi:MAG: hypothetical protein LJE70_13105 [Chromatiaceae bacterium]|nr:hypothetical protein [Chromatiaceae bacterium]